MKQSKTLKNEELKLVLAYVAIRRHAARNRTIILASFLSGMRAHELASLKVRDVVDEDGRIRNEIVLTAAQTKGRRARRVFLNVKLKRELAAYVKSDCANKPLSSSLFVSQKDKAFSPNTMCQLFLNIYSGCSLKGASSHSGRRTFITNLASKSVSVRVLAELAGHSSIATTQRYIEVNDEQLRKAVELLGAAPFGTRIQSTREGENEMSNDQPYIARVRLPNGAVQKIEVQAQNAGNARAMVEAQYGKENVIYVGR